MSPQDEQLLRQAIDLSRQARAAGDEPYGALLADASGRVLAMAVNRQHSTRDCTAHAELNLMRELPPDLGAAQLAACTVYASGEPCPMCAGALYWAGVGRVVYALSIETMTELGGPQADELGLHCREVLATGSRRTEVLGPALEAEARRVFEEPLPRAGPP